MSQNNSFRSDTRLPSVGAIRWIWLVGWLLMGSGAFHLAVWYFAGGGWEGDVSWRKPILFGFSAGATMLSMAWLAAKVPPRKGDTPLFYAFGWCMLLEVTLITLQQWRGVPSHFNRDTHLDAAILAAIEILITLATLVILDLTMRSFRPLKVPADMRLAIRAGMVLLALGCILGFVIAGIGHYQHRLGEPHTTYGAAGVLKFPHGMPLHAIQYLPILAWGLARLGVGEVRRRAVVSWVVGSMALFTVFSCLQTFAGRDRFDVSATSLAVFSLAVALLILPPVWAFCDRRTTQKNSPASSKSTTLPT